MICTLKDLYIHVTHDGELWEYKSDFEGVEAGDGTVIEGEKHKRRQYYCNNCKRYFNGEETFTAKEHLGKPNQILHPF